jgi:hypothetical protein
VVVAAVNDHPARAYLAEFGEADFVRVVQGAYRFYGRAE